MINCYANIVVMLNDLDFLMLLTEFSLVWHTSLWLFTLFVLTKCLLTSELGSSLLNFCDLARIGTFSISWQ